ncbi:MAG: YceI family protein [Saprospiraceae bacterium]|nr:YceI family protein [Saprospiraceae bacterium]
MTRTFLILINLVLALTITTAQKPYLLTSGSLDVMGTSTLHDWTSKVEKMSGKAQLTIDENNVLTGIQSFTWSCKATDLISEHGSIMDKNSWKALDADHYPTISYKLKSVTKITPAGNGWELATVGDLTLHGVTKTIQMNVKATMDPSGTISFTGSHAMKMTDYKVDPPTVMLGTLKTGDDLTIKYTIHYAFDKNMALK